MIGHCYWSALVLKSGSHPSGEGRRQGTLGSGDTHTRGKVNIFTLGNPSLSSRAQS